MPTRRSTMNRTARLLTSSLVAAVLGSTGMYGSTALASQPDAPMGPLAMAAAKPNGKPVTGDADEPSISANGRYVTYTSKNTKVVGQPANGFAQVFRYDTKTHETIMVSSTP